MRHGVTGRGGLRWVSAQSLGPAAPSLPGLSPAGRCPMTTAPSTALVTIQPTFTDPERLALAGFLAGYRGLTREAYALDLRQFTTWCRARSLSAAPISNALPATWKPGVAPAPPSPGGCPPSPGSTGTRSKKRSWITPRPRTSGARGWTTNPTPLPWTATNWEPAGGRGARPAARACADLPARAERAAGIGGYRRRHRAHGPGAGAPYLDDHP